MKIKFSILFLAAVLTLTVPVFAQSKARYNYAAQKKFIPAELGQIYLGMPFRAFAGKFDLTKAEADARYQWIEITIPYAKGNLAELRVKIHGISEEEKETFLRKETVKRKDPNDATLEWTEEISRIDTSKIPAKGVLYEINAKFKKDFDLKNYSLKMFGQPKAEDVYKKGDDYHIFDIQWTKRSSDNLVWLIRYHEETRVLQLAGRIDGSEWDPEA